MLEQLATLIKYCYKAKQEKYSKFFTPLLQLLTMFGSDQDTFTSKVILSLLFFKTVCVSMCPLAQSWVEDGERCTFLSLAI